ncbi:MlaD family protein [Conexibacter sp. SYSU D00693]|uniref:MlaD family protein n=1 Tax=Conexibacter sp. SYSU D00693 TaxID=2812560 RepID=UPI00196B1196|nr:MlaD family protein [Conexibacter sp. SYSU D00693]
MIDPRTRRTRGLNQARLRLEATRSMRPAVAVALGLALGVGLLLFILARVNPNALTDTSQVRFAVDDVTAVQEGLNDVKLKGVPIGTVKEVEVRGDQPVLRVEVRDEFGPIFKDARAELRPTTALQDMYLDVVDRGHPSAGVADPDEPLAPSQTKLPVNVSDVLNVFGPSQRLRLRTLLDDLGNGMADRGRSLRALVVQLVPFIHNAGEISRQLARRAPKVRRLVHDTAVLTQEVGRRQEALRKLVRDGATTLGTLQDGRGDLDATLRELPPALAAVDASFTATRGVLGDVDGALRALSPVAGQLPQSLTGLRRLAGDLRPAIRALRAPVGDLVPLARELRPLAADLDRAVDQLAPQADTVDKVTRNLASCKEGVQGFFQWNASISKFGDARGPIPRGNVVLGAQSSSLLNDPGEVAPQACTPGKVIGGRVPTAKDMH